MTDDNLRVDDGWLVDDGSNKLQFDPKIKEAINKSFWEGFDACLEMVINSLDSQDSNEIARFSVWDFIEDFKAHLLEEAELYRTDG